MKFNTNNYVKVKLTQYGLQIHTRYIDNIIEKLPDSLKYKYDYYALNTDNEEYTEFQLWELMKIFGQYMGNGNENCFETEIIIPNNKSEDKESDFVNYQKMLINKFPCEDYAVGTIKNNQYAIEIKIVCYYYPSYIQFIFDNNGEFIKIDYSNKSVF